MSENKTRGPRFTAGGLGSRVMDEVKGESATATKRRRAQRASASAWEKLEGRERSETLAYRDVYDGQQLERRQLERKRSKTPAKFGGAVVGVLVFVLAWSVWSGIAAAVSGFTATSVPTQGGQGAYYVADSESDGSGGVRRCFRPLNRQGERVLGSQCYASERDVPVPRWAKGADQPEGGPQAARQPTGLGTELLTFSGFKLFICTGLGLAAGLGVGTWFTRRIDAVNLMHDTSDINQHVGDQHIALPEEVQRKFDWFPDAGAHASVEVSSMISHMMLLNKGLNLTTQVARRHKHDVIDPETGEVLAYAGEEVYDERTGEVVVDELPMIDEAFGDALFEASGVPADPTLRIKYRTDKIPYNPGGKDRSKQGDYATVADYIRADWEMPEYETQRPAGAYMVDTAPVNTMVLAMTRAGKGQTYIEPVIDMWLREKNAHNMVINDPKGELLVKNYVAAAQRGFEVVQFNLINAMKTDIYNPLTLAYEAAREGDSTKCALYVENIAEVFFPLDGGEDPVWPNAANNAFKRAAYGLIDFYLEEERELRAKATRTGMDPELLEQELDDMWGKVTLYNCYQFFVQLTSKKVKNPRAEHDQKVKDHKFEPDSPEEAEARDEADERMVLWEGRGEQDMLSLYFAATELLPRNTMRTLVGNAHNALKSMAGAEKMLASVYGIAITAMSFFTDPTISTLTSGKPSQNVDLGGLSFPRRMGVRFAPEYLSKHSLVGRQVVWSAYADAEYSQPLGPDFDHSDIVSREGWARYYFKGKFPQDQAWLKLELRNPATKVLVGTFYFHFKKAHLLSLSGRHYVVEPVTGRKVVRGGVLREVVRREVAPSAGDGEAAVYEFGEREFTTKKLELVGEGYDVVTARSRVIVQTSVRYSEQPKAVFLVTPPHLMKYAKLILILVKQLVDLNFDKSYMTKSDQKPLYKTRFMLDELGNMQSEGKGIAGFETMLSIGLGQEQQFTLILQTLQQLRDVYGDSIDRIVQGNAQPLSAKIATPEGWTTMGEVEVGTKVLTPAGATTEVVGVFPQGERPVYQVTRRDGSSTEACDEHLWEVIVFDQAEQSAAAVA